MAKTFMYIQDCQDIDRMGLLYQFTMVAIIMVLCAMMVIVVVRLSSPHPRGKLVLKCFHVSRLAALRSWVLDEVLKCHGHGHRKQKQPVLFLVDGVRQIKMEAANASHACITDHRLDMNYCGHCHID